MGRPPKAEGAGSIYRRTIRGKQSPWYWLRFPVPGRRDHREPTKPRTADPAEAWRQLRARQAELPTQRRGRVVTGQVTVRELLGLYVDEALRLGRQIPCGRVEAWLHVLGDEKAVDVQTAHVDTILDRWREHGVDFPERESVRVRPINKGTCAGYIAVLRRAFTLGRMKCGLVTTIAWPRFKPGKRGQYLTNEQSLAICASFQARTGVDIKAKLFRLAYLLGTRRDQLRFLRKPNVRILAGDCWKLVWSAEETKQDEAHEIALAGEAKELVQWAWARRIPESDFVFHVHGRPVGTLASELRRTCALLGIPYGRRDGVIFHDTRHSAITNMIASGAGEAAAMTITGHVDPSVFKRYNVRRDTIQTDVLAQMERHVTRPASIETARRKREKKG